MKRFGRYSQRRFEPSLQVAAAHTKIGSQIVHTAIWMIVIQTSGDPIDYTIGSVIPSKPSEQELFDDPSAKGGARFQYYVFSPPLPFLTPQLFHRNRLIKQFSKTKPTEVTQRTHTKANGDKCRWSVGFQRPRPRPHTQQMRRTVDVRKRPLKMKKQVDPRTWKKNGQRTIWTRFPRPISLDIGHQLCAGLPRICLHVFHRRHTRQEVKRMNLTRSLIGVACKKLSICVRGE